MFLYLTADPPIMYAICSYTILLYKDLDVSVSFLSLFSNALSL